MRLHGVCTDRPMGRTLARSAAVVPAVRRGEPARARTNEATRSVRYADPNIVYRPPIGRTVRSFTNQLPGTRAIQLLREGAPPPTGGAFIPQKGSPLCVGFGAPRTEHFDGRAGSPRFQERVRKEGLPDPRPRLI
eukprot:2387370-Prymnesium_polylepis.2